MKTKQWIYNFNSLDPNQQLEIAKALVEELKDNERYLDAEDEYNNEMSQAIRLFFNKMVKNANTKQDLKALKTTLSCFQSLSPERQSKVIESIVSSIQHYYEIQEQEQKESICQREDHLFDEWRKVESKYSHHIDSKDNSYYDHNGYLRSYTTHTYEDYDEIYWIRTCKRCGYSEKSLQEPKEVIEKRKEEEKQARIKKLEKELRVLKEHQQAKKIKSSRK